MFLTVVVCLGAQATDTRGPKKGYLVIVGGGNVGPDIVQKFVSLAGGPEAKVVVIPTASEDKDLDLEKIKKAFIERFGMSNVTMLHTRDKKVADTEEFARPIREAKAVWIPGGRQWRLADSYLGTAVEREIKALLKRGGVVGGSSAGATIQGSYLVRGAVEGNTIMMAKGHEEGFGLLTHSAIDQHLLTRKRQEDLVPVIAAHPDVLGIGLDESTAIVVHGDEFQVIGKSKVAVYDGKLHEGKKYVFLSPGERFNLKKDVVESAAESGNQ